MYLFDYGTFYSNISCRLLELNELFNIISAQGVETCLSRLHSALSSSAVITRKA